MERFLRTKALLGEENFLKLKDKTVAVFGVGGVGSYAAESLVRSGVGNIYIYDNDKDKRECFVIDGNNDSSHRCYCNVC